MNETIITLPVSGRQALLDRLKGELQTKIIPTNNGQYMAVWRGSDAAYSIEYYNTLEDAERDLKYLEEEHGKYYKKQS